MIQENEKIKLINNDSKKKIEKNNVIISQKNEMIKKYEIDLGKIKIVY